MANFNIDYLVVAGGGGGGLGGGGAGGYRTSFGTGNINGGNTPVENTLTLATGSPGYTVTIGAGGAGIVGNGTLNQSDSGNNSVFSSITSTGGGGAGTGGSSGSFNAGVNGGSGGGSHNNYTAGAAVTNPTQGFSGGIGTNATGGGGGGAGGAGNNNTTGGVGLDSLITGTSTPYAGGGGGYPSGAASYGGGAAGGAGTGSSAAANTGAGGGGGVNGGAGGSGVVILRYTTADVASYTATGLTPTEDTTTIPGQTILSFTTVGTGTITFTAPAIPITTFDGTRATTPVTGFDKINTTQGLKLPSGTNANQPSGVQGMIRNDTGETTGSSASAIEHHNGTNWQYFAATESAVVDPTLVLYLNANDPASGISSTSWVDISANNYALTSNGTPALTGTSPQKEYDIASGDYFGLPNTAPPFGATNGVISVECWVKLNTNTSRAYFFSTSSTTNSNDYFYIGWLSDLGNVYVAYRNGTTSDQYFELGALSGNTSWQHIFCQLNGATKEIWINGIQQSTTSTGTGSSSGWVDYVSYATSTSTNIGILRKTSIAYGDANYGQIRYWNNSKTQAEIIAFFNERATDFGKTPIT